MINIEYDIWYNVCDSMFEQDGNSQKNYLQWYPFSQITDKEKEYIKSEVFFNKFILNGAIFKNELSFDFPQQYLQKTNASFRNARLVSPFIYLYIECIGYKASQSYIRKSETVRCYYAGNFEENDFHYKKSYGHFFADINESSRHYDYYYKFDVTDFFDNIDINLLFKMINLEENIFDLRSSLIYKRLLQSIGNGRYPIVENSSGLSYLATYVYLDLVDKNLEESLDNDQKILDFQLIRYVDDLYVFFNTDEEDLNNTLSRIKNNVIHEYQKIHLNINEHKSKYGKSENVGEALATTLYGHYVNGKEIDIASLFKEGNIHGFLDELYEELSSHNHTVYKAVLDRNFTDSNIKYSSDEVFRGLIYYSEKTFENPDIVKKLKKLITADYQVIKYDTRSFIQMILNTRNGALIKFLLSKIFMKKDLDTFDMAISLNYLLLRNFQHTELIEKTSEYDIKITKYIELYCQESFLTSFFKTENVGFLNLLKKDIYTFNNDKKVWYLHFMFRYHEKNNDTLESFSYYKTYFDRATSLLMYYKEINNKNRAPNYKRHYSAKNIRIDYKKLDSGYYEDENIHELIGRAQKLRNSNPMNHSSAEIIDDEKLNNAEIKRIISKLEILLQDSFTKE